MPGLQDLEMRRRLAPFHVGPGRRGGTVPTSANCEFLPQPPDALTTGSRTVTRRCEKP